MCGLFSFLVHVKCRTNRQILFCEAHRPFSSGIQKHLDAPFALDRVFYSTAFRLTSEEQPVIDIRVYADGSLS